LKFVIYASEPYNEASGGSIALHLLCRRLLDQGDEAAIWLGAPGEMRIPLSIRQRARKWARILRSRWGRTYANPFGVRLAKRSDLKGAIIVYAEIVAGNPLRGGKVVRWLLNKPGRLFGVVDFGPDELFFFYQEAFNDLEINPHEDRLLRVTWLNEIYHQDNHGPRSGTSYIMRKGKKRRVLHDLNESIQVDGMTAGEKARVFNETKRFYSYDLYSFYSVYAAICGCESVVVPDPDVPIDQWMPEEMRYGLAYGEDQLEWAASTRHLMLQRLEKMRQDEDEMVTAFREKCRKQFG
jgi:hypothetical protein